MTGDFYLMFFFIFSAMFGHKLTQKCLTLMRGTQESKLWVWNLHIPE